MTRFLVMLCALFLVSPLCAQDQRISLDPEIPTQGQSVTISYDFHGTGMSETRLEVLIGPGDRTTTYTVTAAAPSVTITIPSDGTSYLVEDIDGPSPDKSGAVKPGGWSP